MMFEEHLSNRLPIPRRNQPQMPQIHHKSSLRKNHQVHEKRKEELKKVWISGQTGQHQGVVQFSILSINPKKDTWDFYGKQ